MAGRDLRLATAIALGRLAGSTSRALHLGGGTTLPGDVARAVDRDVLRKLTSSLRQGVVLVTGTNGKTTTSSLLRKLLQGAGLAVGGNSSGANLVYGLTAAALDATNRKGRSPLDWLVLEVDELSAPRAVAEIGPRGLVVLNAFRDQLDRSFEIDQVAARLQEAVLALPKGAFWVGNSDDPRIASFLPRDPDQEGTRILFGLSVAGHRSLPAVTDARNCPHCRSELEFDAVFYAHCGLYRCSACGFTRPDPQVRGEAVRLAGMDRLEMEVAGDGGWRVPLSVPLGGLFNAANVAAAVAAAVAAGADPAQMAGSLDGFEPTFGRSQLAKWKGAELLLMLAKNPAGLEENLASVLAFEHGPVLGLALNDAVADGRDISWIWDADMEALREAADLKLVVSGTRAHELALRLGYAGVGEERIVVRPRPEDALSEIARIARPGTPAPCLLTYTAMLAWHGLLVRSGSGSAFFEAR